MSLLSLGAGDISEFCTQMAKFFRIVGYVLWIFKLAIPLLIVGLGMFDLGKAVVAEKEDEIKKQGKRLIFRVIAGIIIFLIPNIILWIFDFTADYSSEKDQAGFETCQDCLLTPSKCAVSD